MVGKPLCRRISQRKTVCTFYELSETILHFDLFQLIFAQDSDSSELN